jgi:hypothetical protein
MPTNVTPHYQKAEQEYHQAQTLDQKIKSLRKMLSLAPSHKGGEKLRKDIKQRIAKLKYAHEKEIQATKGKGGGLNIKKEGAAQVVLLGKTNSGKSFLLSKLTNANPLVAEYEFTTKKPQIGTMEYTGVPIQLIEMPAITENFIEKDKGPMLMGVIRGADLVVILAEYHNDAKFIRHELKEAGVIKRDIVVSRKESVEDIKNRICSYSGHFY